MYLIINYCVLRKLLKIYNILEWVNYQNSQEKELPWLFCRKNYKGYLLESRLHFRIHAVRLQLSGPVNDGVGSIDQDLDSDPRPVGEESNSTSIPKDDSTSSLSTNL